MTKKVETTPNVHQPMIKQKGILAIEKEWSAEMYFN